MTAALPLLPPVIDQSIQRVPLDVGSAISFALLACASTYLAFRRSPWIAALLAFGVPFAAYRDVAQTTITVEKCLVFGAVVGLLLGGAPLWPRTRAARLVFLAGTAILLAIALSSVNATYRWPAVREFFKQAEYLALFWCAASFVERIDRSRAYFMAGAAASAAIVSTLAVSQAVIGGAPSGIWVNDHPLPRVAGALEGPNQLAGFLEAALPILWVWPMLTFAWKPLRNYITGASSAALILTQSRAGVVMAALSYALLWRMQRATARASLATMTIGAAFGLIVSAVWFVFWAHASFADIQRLFFFAVPAEPGGVGTRMQLWPAAIELFRRHPIFGVGAGNYELLLSSVGLHGIQTHASSLWLQTLAEQGIVGFSALLVFAYVALRQTFALRRNSALGIAAFLAVASLLTHQLVDDLFFFPKVAALCWLLLGAGTATALRVRPGPSADGKTQMPLAAAEEALPSSRPGIPASSGGLIESRAAAVSCRGGAAGAAACLFGFGMMIGTVFAAHADQKPETVGVKLTVAADQVKYYSDEATIQAHGNVHVWLSNGVTIDGDACSINMSLRRFVVAGHVRLQTPAGTYAGAAFAGFLPFHREYFIPLGDLPDRWTFLDDDWAHPEKGREMPGDAFFLADLSDAHPFISAKRAVIDPENYVKLAPASFDFFNSSVQTPPLPPYVRNFSDNQNFAVNALSGATFDIPYGVAGSPASLDTLHFRYDPQRKTYFSLEHHSVFGEQGYAVFSLNPGTQPSKQWNLLSYAPTSSGSALALNAQLFTFQHGLSEPLSSNGFVDIQYTQSLRQSVLKVELTQLYDSLLAPTPLGYYGDPSHPFVPNHPIVSALSWSGFDQRLGASGFSFRLITGAGEMHDIFGVSGTTLHDVQTLYASAILSTPTYRAPFNTAANGSYQFQHVWLSFPNGAGFQTVTISDSKRFANKFFLTGSLLLQSVVTKNAGETVASPNASTGMVPQPASSNGFPALAGVATVFPHVTNSALILTGAVAPSPSFQFTVVAQRNHYTPVQQPFVAGPPRYQATADARMRISKTLFLDVGRSYYFNWANQRWSPTFALQVSAQ